MGIITVLSKAPHPQVILSCRFSKDRTHVFTGCADGKTRLFKLSDATEPKAVFFDDELDISPCSVTSVAVPKTEKRIVTTSYSEGFIKIWQYNENYETSLMRTIREDRNTLGLVNNPSDSKLLSLGSDGIIYYYDIETGQKVRSFMNSLTSKIEGHTSRVFSAVFHPLQLHEFISGGWDNTIQYWDIRRATSFKYILGPHVCGEGLDINYNGSMILSCSYRTNDPFELWEYNTGKLYLTLDNNNNKLYCGKWVAPMYLLTGSSEPSILRVINMYNIKTISFYKTNDVGVYCLDGINTSRKLKKDEELQACCAFSAGTNMVVVKLEYAHQ